VECQSEKAVEGSNATEVAEGSLELKLAKLLRSVKLWLRFEKASHLEFINGPTLNSGDPITFELVRSEG